MAKKTSSRKTTATKTKRASAPKRTTAKRPTTKRAKAAKTAKATTKRTKAVKGAKTVKAAKTTTAKVKRTTASKAKTARKTTRASSAKTTAKAPVLKGYEERRAAKVSTDSTLMDVAKLKKVKTGLTRKDLQNYRKQLLEKRLEIIGDVVSLEGDALREAGNLSNMPLHMADVGSDNYEQEFSLGLAESERKLLREIDHALERLMNGYYGVCMLKGVPIGKPRLDAKPWARYCIEAVRELERQGRM